MFKYHVLEFGEIHLSSTRDVVHREAAGNSPCGFCLGSQLVPRQEADSDRRSRIVRTGHPFGFVAGSPNMSRKMNWVRVSSWARAARRLARSESALSRISAIRRCSGRGGRGTASLRKMSSGRVRSSRGRSSQFRPIANANAARTLLRTEPLQSKRARLQYLARQRQDEFVKTRSELTIASSSSSSERQNFPSSRLVRSGNHQLISSNFCL